MPNSIQDRHARSREDKINGFYWFEVCSTLSDARGCRETHSWQDELEKKISRPEANAFYKLRELGLSARLFDAASGVGGIWYWSRYPGARLDSKSYKLAVLFFVRSHRRVGLERASCPAGGSRANRRTS